MSPIFASPHVRVEGRAPDARAARAALAARNAPAAFDLDEANAVLDGATPERVIAFAAERFGDGLVLATSFGIQAAVTLHLVTRVVPEIPVLWVDTGYLPPETYRYADALAERLGLNLQVYQSPVSPARMEALHGRLYEASEAESLDRYDRLRKVEPFQRGLRELGARAWISGVRADQTDFRQTLRRIDRHGTRIKVHPILDWSTRDVYRYLVSHDLPPHPLFEQGYATVGDVHSSRPLADGDASERETRFRGLKQECGIQLTPDEESRMSSGL